MMSMRVAYSVQPLSHPVIMRPHANDLDRTLIEGAVPLNLLFDYFVNEAVLQADAARVEAR